MAGSWTDALERLLSERRPLKKGELAKLAGVRPGTISAMVTTDTPPSIPTLQALASALTEYDRRGNPTAPAVEVWEFFVSDEQARVLRDMEVARQKAVQQAQAPSMADTVAALAQSVAALQQQLAGTPAVTGHLKESPSLPSGDLQRPKRRTA